MPRDGMTSRATNAYFDGLKILLLVDESLTGDGDAIAETGARVNAMTDAMVMRADSLFMTSSVCHRQVRVDPTWSSAALAAA